MTRERQLRALRPLILRLDEHARRNVDAMCVPSLIGSSLALFCAAGLEDRALPEPASLRERALACIETGVQKAESPTLESGLCGVGFVIELLRARHGLDVSSKLMAAIDDGVRIALGEREQDEWLELLYGLSGVGVYAATRLHARSGRRLAKLVVERIAAAQRAEGRPFDFVLDGFGRHENFGMAHGLFGMLGALHGLAPLDARASALAMRVQSYLVEALVSASARSLRMPSSCVPLAVMPDGKSEFAFASRWCYGDLGYVAGFASVTRDAGLRMPRAARTLALRLTTGRLADERAAFLELPVCHGAAGNALLWKRLTRAFRHPAITARYDAWSNRMLQLLSSDADARIPVDFSVDHSIGSLLGGRAGIAAVLLDELGALAPEWDAMLGLRVPRPL